MNGKINTPNKSKWLMLLTIFFATSIFCWSSTFYPEKNVAVNQSHGSGTVKIEIILGKGLHIGPNKVYLKRRKVEYTTKTRHQYILTKKCIDGQNMYLFNHVNPGKYRIGLSFIFLMKDWSIEEYEYDLCDIGEKTNHIEVLDNKTNCVKLTIKIDSQKRPNLIKEYQLVPRYIAKKPEEEKMLDENYFTPDYPDFYTSRRESKKECEELRIIFRLIRFYDEEPPKK